jgi:hypothetical protein
MHELRAGDVANVKTFDGQSAVRLRSCCHAGSPGRDTYSKTTVT